MPLRVGTATRRSSSVHDAAARRKSGPAQKTPTVAPTRGRESVTTTNAPRAARGEMESYFSRLCSLDPVKEKPCADAIGPHGLAQLFADLHLAPSTLESWVLLWRIGACHDSSVRRREWVGCMYTYGIESISQLRPRLDVWLQQVHENAALFAHMYNFLYDYIRGERDRLMPPAQAIAAWRVFFADCALCSAWCDYAEDHLQEPVSRDLWRQVHALLRRRTASVATGGDGSSAADGPTALPSIVDDFLRSQAEASAYAT